MNEDVISSLISEYTFISREENMYSEFPKKIRAFKKLPGPVYRFLPTQKYVRTISREDHRQRPTVDVTYNGQLSEEQHKIFSVIRERSEKHNYNCGLINMKTGKGKSHIIMKLTSFFGGETLILCHNKKTLVEMVSKFKEFTDVAPGVYYGDKKDIKPITITTHDSFVLNGGVIGDNDWKLILYDECDYNTSQDMLQALCMTNALYMYGLTGTPYRKDLNNADLQKIFGKEVCVTKEADQAYNLIPKIIQLKYKSPNRSDYMFSNWAEQKGCLVEDSDRLDKQISLVNHVAKKRKTILILTERVEEAKNYLERLAGHPTHKIILITGETKLKDDNKSIEENVGTHPCIIIGTVGKMARGVDIPAIDTIFMYSALHFRGTTVQAVGRALRTYEGKTDVMIYDWGDYPMLSKQLFERRKSYMKEYSLTLEKIKLYDIQDSDTWEL